MTRQEVVPVSIPGQGHDYQAVVVLLEEDGLQGVGEAPVVPGRTSSLRSLLSEFRGGAQPRSTAARAALETARLDLEAKRAGLPLAELLGGVRRRSVECTALVTSDRPAEVAREVERLAMAGFEAFKLKALAGAGPLDLERLGAARWAGGRGARLRLDLNGSLTRGEAMARLCGLAPFRLELVEQPLPERTSVDEWMELAASSGLLLAADESLADAAWADQLAAAGLALAIKLATVGGPLRACSLAAAARGPVSLGSSLETSIGLAAALHVACALVPQPLACGLATRRLLDDDLAHGLRLLGAQLLLPESFGLGVELDRAALETYRVDR